MHQESKMNEVEIAKVAIAFLNRAQLQGSEVMAFATCMQWLQSKCVEPQAVPGEGVPVVEEQ